MEESALVAETVDLKQDFQDMWYRHYLLLAAELGDFDPKRHTTGYVSEFQLLPNQTEELEERIASVHRELM